MVNLPFAAISSDAALVIVIGGGGGGAESKTVIPIREGRGFLFASLVTRARPRAGRVTGSLARSSRFGFTPCACAYDATTFRLPRFFTQLLAKYSLVSAGQHFGGSVPNEIYLCIYQLHIFCGIVDGVLASDSHCSLFAASSSTNGPSHIDDIPPAPRHIRYTKIVRDACCRDPIKLASYRRQHHHHHHLGGQARSVNRGEDLHLEEYRFNPTN